MSDLYRRLQQNLDRMPVPFPATESGVEIRILQRLFSPEEAEAALALSMIPETPGTIRRRLPKSWTLERLVPLLDSMAEKGLIERMKMRGRRRYSKSVLAVGIYERQLTSLTAELQRDVEAYFEEGFGAAFQTATPRQLRTVPVNLSLDFNRTVASYDDIRAFVTNSAGPFAVMDCICRHGRDLTGERCQQTEMRRTCLTFGPAAKGMVHSGAAQFVERNETLEILEAADREGLVLQPQNTKDPLFICCCCGCCCGVLRSAKVMPEPAALFKSSYHAVSNPETCAGCAICETRCQMDAIQMIDDTAAVDLARCIGCGLCVTTCSTESMRLVANPAPAEPPDTTPGLYLEMYRDRFGTYETAKALGKALVGRQV